MADLFEIPVTYRNHELSFKAHVIRFGYVNHILVDIDGRQVTIERDEEGNFRALADPEMSAEDNVDLELVKAIVGVLESL